MRQLREPRGLIHRPTLKTRDLKSLTLLSLMTLATLMALLAAGPEIAAKSGDRIDAGNGATRYHISGIVDDPDPTTRVWTRQAVNSPSPSRLESAALAATSVDPIAPGAGAAFAADAINRATVGVWLRETERSPEIVVSRFDGAAWSEPVAVTTVAESELSLADPDVAVDAVDGTVHLVYSVRGNGRARVMHRQGTTSLLAWSQTVEVSSFGETAVRPSVGVQAGRLWVAYENHFLGLGNTPREVVIATRDSRRLDEPFVAETLASSFSPELSSGPLRPTVQIQDGVLWVEWIDWVDQLAWTRRESDGSWGSIEIEPFADDVDREIGARERIRAKATF